MAELDNFLRALKKLDILVIKLVNWGSSSRYKILGIAELAHQVSSYS